MRAAGHATVIVLMSALWPSPAAANSDRALATATRLLTRAVTPQPDESHLLLLTALRQLGDPSLRSFFLQLAQDGEPRERIHAILGLAEIDEAGRVDPWLISQLDSSEARYAAISSALDLDLVGVEQFREFLEWDDLEARPRVLLLAELDRAGEPLDREPLESLAGHEDLVVAGVAAALLAGQDDGSAFTRWRSRFVALPPEEQVKLLPRLLRLIEHYELTSAAAWVADVLESADLPPGLEARGVSTLLVLDPARGVAAWKRALGEHPGYGRLIRYALLLLPEAPRLPPEAFDRLPDDDPLLAAARRAGRAVAEGRDRAEALIDLLEMGHPVASRWVVEVAGQIPDDEAASVYASVIDIVGSERPTRRGAAVAELAFMAAARLFAVDRDRLLEMLEQAEDDSRLQQAILMGLLETRAADAGVAAERVRRLGYGRADSLALLLIAKHAEALSPQQLARLEVLAAGGGEITEMLQIQAAWLYLKHAGKIEPALATVFAAEGNPGERR